jgi:dipeptide transport system substrate-binding protein
MGMQKLIKNIIKVDDYQIKVVLKQPEAPFLANLAMPFMSILSAEYGAQLSKVNKRDDIDIFPVGTGPFFFRRYLKDSTIRYQAHTDYCRGKSNIDDLIFAITPDPGVRYMKLKKGECDIIIYPSPADLDNIKKQKGLQLAEEKGLNIGYLAMNTEKAPFNNILVRRAIAHALNKEAYVKAIYLGNAETAINPYPPAMWSYNKDVAIYDYNPEKAKALLKEAGLEHGFKTTIWTLPVSRPYNPNGETSCRVAPRHPPARSRCCQDSRWI